jgi:hypothetical protein
VDSKKVDFLEVESRMVVIRAQGTVGLRDRDGKVVQ